MTHSRQVACFGEEVELSCGCRQCVQCKTVISPAPPPLTAGNNFSWRVCIHNVVIL